MGIEDRYNKIYSESVDAFKDGQPEDVVEDILTYRTHGTAFELGTGQGRNALFLAKKGFVVTARDISPVGIESLREKAAKEHAVIATEVGDVQDLADENYDVWVSTYVFHHLLDDGARQLIKHMRAHTNPGGLNALTTFTQNGDFYQEESEKGKFYPAENELKELYDGWEILRYEEIGTIGRQRKPDGTPTKNVTAKILAQKPIDVTQ